MSNENKMSENTPVAEPENRFEIEETLDAAADRSYSQGALIRRRFFRHRGAMIALTVLTLIILMAFTSSGIGPIPGWWPKNYLDVYPTVNGGAPTFRLWPFRIGEHPFGQTTVGKDYFALVMEGARKSLIIAFSVGAIATTIGTIIGSAAGYFRGWIESVLMRATDLVIIIPLLVLASVLGRMTNGNNIFFLAGVLGIVVWTGLARLVRGEVLSLREREFVHAAKAIGTSNWRIIFRHILPNSVGVIVVNSTLLIASAILLETALSYLGFGVKAPETSLGLLISEYQTALTTRPWLFWWPGMFILAIALCVNFIGDGLRDAFDPRQQTD
ncbi:ABC transporter permease [Arachnia propionica]|uniref:ABC transporter permease n=1 Tax=Arachnia propionica TaxID=1750 RepID=A0A3P1WSV5_9ACTN|nr:ABC transporter permease [Arachnia propionica]RRD49699.1 ABC transporter permease [Arachnia propionica]